MRPILTLTAVLSAASLTACAQTANPEQTSPHSNTESTMTFSANDTGKTGSANPKGTALPPPELTEGQYWIKTGLAGLYDGSGNMLKRLANPGPHRIYERQNGFVKISMEQDHWAKLEDLTQNKPKLRPILKTDTPDRPITRFPGALEEEAKQRGIEMKKKDGTD